LRAYRFLFYRLYAWGRRKHGLRDLPAYNSIVGLSMIGTMNVLSGLMAAETLAGLSLGRPGSRSMAVVVWLALLGLHARSLVWGGRVQQISEELESQRLTIGEAAFCWLYPLASIVGFFSLLGVRW